VLDQDFLLYSITNNYEKKIMLRGTVNFF